MTVCCCQYVLCRLAWLRFLAVWRKFCHSNAKHCNKQHRMQQLPNADSVTATSDETAAKDVVKTVTVSRRNGNNALNR
jgi:hypothetical protein